MNENSTLEYFSRSTTDALRGLAVILLLIGHLCMFGIAGRQPFEHAGVIAVVIFLYLSAVGLTKTYRLAPCPSSFFYKRVRKLLMPLWLSAALFYCLDAYLLDKTYPVLGVLLNFVGIISLQSPNPATWFVSYILFLYVVFFLCSQLSSPGWLKIVVMMVVIAAVMTILDRVPVLRTKYFYGASFMTVFPLSVAATLYGGQCLDRLRRFSGRQSALMLIALLLTSALIYFASDRLRTPQLIILLTLLVFWFDSHGYRIRALSWLGTISYEIYLLHMPFMLNYGFVVGKEHIWLYFAGYCLILIPASYVFSKGCAFLTDRLLPINHLRA